MSNTHIQKQGTLLARGIPVTILFLCIGTASFSLGFRSAGDVETVERTVAQAADSTMINIILQYQPVSGGAPIPIEVTPFMNSSQSALLHLQEIHTAQVYPSDPEDRCRTTNSLGRCSVENIPVGYDVEEGVFTSQQYDIFVDTVFIEFMTGIALEHNHSFVRYESSMCNDNTTNFSGDSWCLTTSGGSFAPEYYVTITLSERNDCLGSVPPASFCSSIGESVTFICNPSYGGSTKPWEPVTKHCDSVQCPDGNIVPGICADITPEFSACSSAVACQDNLLCSVSHFGSSIVYDAGIDTMIIRGERFGYDGGTVRFSTADGTGDVVEIFPGSDWADTEIHVRVPIYAVSGVIEIHPHSHGFLEHEDEFLPVTCNSPSTTIRSFNDQYVILGVEARSPDGVRLVAPGYTTEIQVLVRHNDSLNLLNTVIVELLNGSFPHPDDIPLQRILIASASCPVSSFVSGNVREATLLCSIDIPDDALSFQGPYTFLVTVFDDRGGVERTVLLDAGSSVLAGDFSLDGILTIDDAVIARRIATGLIIAEAEHLLRDVDGDNTITMSDALFILHTITQQ